MILALCERLGGGYWAVMEAPADFVENALIIMAAESEHRQRQDAERKAKAEAEERLAELRRRHGGGRDY